MVTTDLQEIETRVVQLIAAEGPLIGKELAEFVPLSELLPFVEAVVSVWNLLGRRDNKYKARIKITVHEHGIDEIRDLVETRFAETKQAFNGADLELFDEIAAQFLPPAFRNAPAEAYDRAYESDPVFRAWADTNLSAHKAPGYAIAQISLKPHGQTPGDACRVQTASFLERLSTCLKLLMQRKVSVIVNFRNPCRLPMTLLGSFPVILSVLFVVLDGDCCSCSNSLTSVLLFLLRLHIVAYDIIRRE